MKDSIEPDLYKRVREGEVVDNPYFPGYVLREGKAPVPPPPSRPEHGLLWPILLVTLGVILAMWYAKGAFVGLNNKESDVVAILSVVEAYILTFTMLSLFTRRFLC